MLKIDPWNIIWTVVNLLFLYWIFKKFLFDRVMGVINQRDEMIQKQFSEAKKSQDDAESLKSDYKKKLESAKTQADQIILDARARAEAEQEKALERTRQEADSMLEKAKADIASEQDKATKAAEAEIAKLAILAARKIVKTGEANDTGSSNNAIVLYRLAVERRDVEEAQRVYFVTEKLAQTLANPLIPLTKKYDIIEKVYGFESEPKLITSFIKEMVKLGYAAEMNEIFEAYYRYWDEKNHIIRAELISAEAATDEEANDAKALLQSKYPEYEISLTQKVDETLLGGYVIKTLNTEYDRSYEGKLRELERKLTRR